MSVGYAVYGCGGDCSWVVMPFVLSGWSIHCIHSTYHSVVSQGEVTEFFVYFQDCSLFLCVVYAAGSIWLRTTPMYWLGQFVFPNTDGL